MEPGSPRSPTLEEQIAAKKSSLRRASEPARVTETEEAEGILRAGEARRAVEEREESFKSQRAAERAAEDLESADLARRLQAEEDRKRPEHLASELAAGDLAAAMAAVRGSSRDSHQRAGVGGGAEPPGGLHVELVRHAAARHAAGRHAAVHVRRRPPPPPPRPPPPPSSPPPPRARRRRRPHLRPG